MMNLKCWISFIILSVVTLQASSLTWEKLIQSVENDPVMEASKERSSVMEGRTGTKLWNSLEFRYELDGFSFAKHDFELRLKPKSFGEGTATQKQFDSQKKYQEARLAVDRSLLMYDRYERALRYVNRRKIAEINKQLYQVNQDRIEVLHMKAGSENFNTQDLISAIEREAYLRAQMIGDSTALRDAELKMKSWVDFDSVALDTLWLPSMKELADKFQSGVSVNEDFPEIKKAKSKMENEQAKSQLDMAKGNDIISHIGVGYSLKIESLMKKYKDLDAGDVGPSGSYSSYYNDWLDKTGCTSVNYTSCGKVAEFLVSDSDTRQLKDKFFINLAIKLPFLDDNNNSALKNQIAELDAKSDYLDAMRSLGQKVSRLSEEIVALIAQWKVQKEFVDKVNAGNIFEDFIEAAGSDPLLLLRARESALESDLKALKLESDIFERYIVLLDYTGIFANPNVMNHLREALK